MGHIYQFLLLFCLGISARKDTAGEECGSFSFPYGFHSSLLVVSGNYTLHLADDFMYTDPVSCNSVDFGFSGFDHQNSLQSGSVM